MLGQGQYEIKTVSLSKDPVTSIGGFQVLPDYDISSVPGNYEALILIGGLTWRSENNDLKQWSGAGYTGEAKFIAKQSVRDGNIITANGTAPMEFAKEILLALQAASEDKISEWYYFHKLGVYTAPMPRM